MEIFANLGKPLTRFGILSLLVSTPILVQSAPISYEFKGSVNGVDVLLAPYFNFGDEVSLNLTYDNQATAVSQGLGQSLFAFQSLALNIGSEHLSSTDFDSLLFKNDAMIGGMSRDEFLIDEAELSGLVVPNLGPAQLFGRLSDTDANLWDDLEHPTELPALNEFEGQQFTLEFFDAAIGTTRRLFLDIQRINFVSAGNPAVLSGPSTAFLLGLAGLAFIRRRWSGGD